jgi:magnesium chelatase subunit H
LNRRPPQDRDKIVLQLQEQLLEIEQRLIPTGMHVFGRRPDGSRLSDMLRMVASFDRPEAGVRSLPGLVAAGLGFPPYEVLLRESAASPERMEQRERVEALVRQSITEFLRTDNTPGAAPAYLLQEASVDPAASEKVFELLRSIRERLAANDETGALVRALRGEYIEPGPGADIVQNPDILPTGRNTHALNPYGVPSLGAFQKSEQTVAALLGRHREESGRYPESVGMVLWGMDNIKTGGEGVAQALWLMGVAPSRDGMNRVSGVEVVPLAALGRPRIDVVMTVSGIFRDLFGATMELLDRAVRTVAALPEPHELNFIRKHAQESVAQGASPEDATIRVFSNAAGNYGTNVNFMVTDSQWDRPEEIGDLFVTRKCFAYRRGIEGRQARQLMDGMLARVEATFQNLDNSEIGITDVDHYFEYLGGLSQAVASRSGERPKMYLADTMTPVLKIRSLQETVRLETRTKTLNPKWYEGMLQHGFSGVAEIEHHITNTFGWSATAGAVDNWIYDEVAATYVLDDAMLGRLRAANPHATRALCGRLLEASGRGFWDAPDATIERLRSAANAIEDQLEGVSGPAGWRR